MSRLPRRYALVLLAGAAGLGVCAASAIFGSRGWTDLQRLRHQQTELESLAFRLERGNAEMREHLSRLREDDAYLERVARERLGWVRPGEIVYRVEPPRRASAEVTTRSPSRQ